MRALFILTTTLSKLIRDKSKQSLAEYFGTQVKEGYISWKPIEILFNKKNLSSAYSSNGSAYGKTLSRDYEALLKILK